MDQRLFALPLVLAAAVQLGTLLHSSPRWFAAQIAQWTVVLLAAAGAWYFHEDFIWIPIAWGLFTAFVLAPSWLTRRAQRFQVVGDWSSALHWRRMAGRLVWGRTGQLYRFFTRVLTRISHLEHDAARQMIEARASQPMPEDIDGSVRLMRLHTACLRQDWEFVVAQHHADREEWGNDMNARLAALMLARAFAETGAPDAGARVVHDLMRLPGRRDDTTLAFWQTRVAVAALAGDEEELDRLFAPRDETAGLPGRERLEMYWRGRCALANQQHDRAAACFTEVEALTADTDQFWKTALESAWCCDVLTDEPSRERYRLIRDAIRAVEPTWTRWMDLTRFMRPELSTVIAISLLSAVFVAERLYLQTSAREAVWQWLANASDTIVHRQWWRGLTALFLHLNAAHLAMNAFALWMVGASLQRVVGRLRMWTVFLLGGAIGNYASAAFNILQPANDRYDMSVGASSGIFAMIGAYAVAVASFRETAYTTARRHVIVLVMLVVAADSMSLLIDQRVDAVAHLGGFCGGLLVSMIWQWLTGNRPPSAADRVNGS